LGPFGPSSLAKQGFWAQLGGSFCPWVPKGKGFPKFKGKGKHPLFWGTFLRANPKGFQLLFPSSLVEFFFDRKGVQPNSFLTNAFHSFKALPFGKPPFLEAFDFRKRLNHFLGIPSFLEGLIKGL